MILDHSLPLSTLSQNASSVEKDRVQQNQSTNADKEILALLAFGSPSFPFFYLLENSIKQGATMVTKG
jgi:hypothetical protein